MFDVASYLTLPVGPILSELGLEVDRGRCSVPGLGPVEVHPQAVVNLNKQAPLRALGAIEVLAHSRSTTHPKATRLELYEYAVAYVREHHLQRNSEWPGEIKEVAMYLSNLRNLYDLVTVPGYWDGKLTTQKTTVRNFIEKSGVPYHVQDSGISALSGDGVESLIRYLDRCQIEHRLRPAGAGLIQPFYTQLHILAGIHYRPVSKLGREGMFIPILPASVCYMNLPAYRHGQSVVVHQAPFEAAACTDRDAFHTHVLMGGTGNLLPWIPKTRVRILRGEQDGGKVVALARRLTVLGADVGIGREHAQDMHSYILEVVLTETQGDTELSELCVQLLDAAGPGPELKALLTTKLSNMGRMRTLQDLNTRYMDGVLVKQDKYQIQVTPNGYVYLDTKNRDRYPLTNFTIEPYRQIMFPDQHLRHLECRVRVGDQEHDLIFPEDSFESGKKMEAHLMGREFGDREPPRVLDAEKSKHLMNHFKRQNPKLPLRKGISYLGWDGSRERFYCPGMVVEQGQVLEGKAPLHPTNSELRHYTSEFEESKLHADLPQPVCDTISMVLGLIHRTYSGFSTAPILVRNTRDSRKLISGLFRGLGQVSDLSLNLNARARTTPGLKGFPFYTLGEVRKQDTGLPAVVLGETGLLFDQVQDADVKRGAETLRYLVQALVKDLTRDQVLIQEPERRVTLTDALLVEGVRIVRGLTDLASWPHTESAYPHLEQLLQSISVEKAGDFFGYDLPAQRIYLYTQPLDPDIRLKIDEVCLELSKLVRDVRIEKGYLSLPAVEAQNFLQGYYNGDVPYRMVNQAELLKAIES